MSKSTSFIIDHVFFKDLPSEDLTASEMNYIRTRFIKNKDQVSQSDLLDIMYACYKLGYGKACLKAGQELPSIK